MGDNHIVIGFILFFVVASILITWYTTRFTKNTKDFYVAGRSVPWIQVGIAMTGSYLSAASFLGCAGDIGVFGIDSIWLSIGFFGGYMAVLLLVAGPLRNVGSYTVADALHRRFPDDRVKLIVMLSTLVISTFYLVPQMLGAGLLFELLLDWNFVYVTLGIGVLMSIYIIFGGMKSTLYNQVLQAVFLFTTMVIITVMAFFIFGKGSPTHIVEVSEKTVPPFIAGKDPEVVKAVTEEALTAFPLERAALILKQVGVEPTAETKTALELVRDIPDVKSLGKDNPDYAVKIAAAKAKNALILEALTDFPPERAAAIAREKLPKAPNAMTIGVKKNSTLAMISTVIALVFGTAGLPHILIMFYTVPSAKAAKKSVTLCIVALGIFYLCAIILGFLLFPAIYPKLIGWIGVDPEGAGMAKNMAVLEIGKKLGGSWLMAIGAAGAVAAILSTSAGLMITTASTISHDLYKVYVNRNATDKQELMIAKVTTLVMSAVAVILAVALKKENIAWLVMLAFGIAASAIFPAMMANLWWKRATRQGVMAGMVTGLVVSVVFIVMLLTGKKDFLGLPTSGGPGVFGVSASFVMLVVVSLCTQDRGKDVEEFFALAHQHDKD